MNKLPADQAARDRFRREWQNNFAVSANAGSGKTTAISERLAAMALSPESAPVLAKTAVVTFTKKAALQIGQRARAVLLRQIETGGGDTDVASLDQLERVFFGTIHSFCLLLAQRYGQMLGVNLNPAVIAEDDEAHWEAFLEQDEMQFTALLPEQFNAFLRHVPLETIFSLARELEPSMGERLWRRRPRELPPAPREDVLARILALPAKGTGKRNIELSQQAAGEWLREFREDGGFLKLYEPAGTSRPLVALSTEWMQPLKMWLADAGAALAAELAERYRAYRFERGVQTYADQVEAALAVLGDMTTLERIRADGWRVILDEAQDTDPQQFAVLIEITRPVGAVPRTWPEGGGEGPRPGHFCMVGDAQQAIYGNRADIRNFSKHLAAFARGDGGEMLAFHVTFRAPHQVIMLLNESLPAAFGSSREHNVGLPPAEGAPAPLLQVAYAPLVPGPANAVGSVSRVVLTQPATVLEGIDAWLAEEATQLATFLKKRGPAGVGARRWDEVCVLAPRNDWLMTVRKAFEAAGLKVALQMRKNRNGDNPVYAWISGLLAVVCDPENAFEWFGVLREVFGVSDAVLAVELREKGAFKWESSDEHPEPLRDALSVMRPWVLQADDEGMSLEKFSTELAFACALRERARVLDPRGGLESELERILAGAAALSLEGAGPREWLNHLLKEIDEGRPSGKPEADAINLLTTHSSKGLEWPVVIPVGWWRRIGKRPEMGLRLVTTDAQEPRVYFDSGSLPEETRESREREQWRELVRLMYVALTRAREHLFIPWENRFGGAQRSGRSFAELWGNDEQVARLPSVEENTALLGTVASIDTDGHVESTIVTRQLENLPLTMKALPERLLPHQLAEKPDFTRAARHESSSEDLLFLRGGEEAIDYGLWWHETMEHLPWTAQELEVEGYCQRALVAATEQGFGTRASAELEMLRGSEAWAELGSTRWERLTELAVFASLHADAWIDGVIDLVLHDPKSGEVCVVDWKTNRRHAQETDEAMLKRLKNEYRPQLQAYGESVKLFFPAATLSLWIYASAAGKWTQLVDG